MKIIKVISCGQCPYLDFIKGNVSNYCECGVTHNYIDDRLKIPGWCPLEDMPEGANK